MVDLSIAMLVITRGYLYFSIQKGDVLPSFHGLSPCLRPSDSPRAKLDLQNAAFFCVAKKGEVNTSSRNRRIPYIYIHIYIHTYISYIIMSNLITKNNPPTIKAGFRLIKGFPWLGLPPTRGWGYPSNSMKIMDHLNNARLRLGCIVKMCFSNSKALKTVRCPFYECTYITLHYITLHTLHYITLHYIT